MNTVTLYKRTIKKHREPQYYEHGLESHSADGLPHDADEIEYVLPEGYRIAKTQWGAKGVFDTQNMLCDIYTEGQTPILVSAEGKVFLKQK